MKESEISTKKTEILKFHRNLEPDQKLAYQKAIFMPRPVIISWI
jgi:hypothetical protein